MAFAGARFANSLLEAAVLKKQGVAECTYVLSDVVPGLEYFSSVVELGVSPLSQDACSLLSLVKLMSKYLLFVPTQQPEGVTKIHPVPTLNAHEQKLLDAAIPELKANIQKGVDFVKSKKA
jgi:malate dehydrogenase